ncbi:MAG: DNA methyltransferase, partial [Bacteroidota bacterium]
MEQFNLQADEVVLDPFCGTGTTIVESKLNSFHSVGLEANPIVKFAAQTKSNWNVDSDELSDQSFDIAQRVNEKLLSQGIDDQRLISDVNMLHLRMLPEETSKLLIKNSISPVPLHKSLTLLAEINQTANKRTKDHLMLAFIKSLVKDASNLKFGPEVGVGKVKEDASIIEPWVNHVSEMVTDLKQLSSDSSAIQSAVHLADARNPHLFLEKNSIAAVITSPPYPNEKDYSRTTRLETVILGLVG